MKIILGNRGRHKVNKGPMKTVFEKRSRIVINASPVGGSSDSFFRLLEDNDFRITEDGDFRILE
jgi:hypothetical protein